MTVPSSLETRALCECGDPDCPGNVTYAWPFKLNCEYLGDDEKAFFGYMSVRTSSFEWDGERTDLHDLFSLIWAMLLRARDVASVQLIDELNEFSGIESEIYARLLVPRQEGSISKLAPRQYFEALSRESHEAFRIVQDVFGVAASGPENESGGGADYRSPPGWVASARKRLKLQTVDGWEYNHRKAFETKVFTCVKRGVSIVELGEQRAARLRDRLNNFRPAVVDGVLRRAFRTEHLVNAVPLGKLQTANKFLAMLEQPTSDSLIIPMDSHFALIGKTALVALATPCGVEAFDAERVATEAKRAEESDVFLYELEVVWCDRLDDARFEALIGELLLREGGMHWLRRVGATREADDGRDFIAEWSVPPSGLAVAGVADGQDSLYLRRRVVVQVKLRSRGVSRNDLPGLRDMIEHYQCTGLLVVAFPHVTTTLFNHLDELRQRAHYWINWWGRAEIERRLRRYPEIAGRFRDLLVIQRPAARTRKPMDRPD